MTLVLTKKELERIRASVQPSAADHSAAMRRAELKKKSEERLEHWPNTLEALRSKKESFLKDREEKEELKRQELDREEAELTRTARLKAIERANELMYTQTDQMKMLKSQQQYADALHTRKSQITEKQKREEEEKEKERKYHEEILRQVQEGEAREREKEAKRKAELEKVRIVREQQLEEVRKIRAEEERKNREVGLALKEQAKKQLEEDMIQQEKRMQHIAQSNLNNTKANAELKIQKEQILAKEREAEALRDSTVESIENRKKMMKSLEKRRFEKAQVTRQKMIERAVENLARQNNQEQAILNKQEKDIRDRQDRAIADKEAKRKKEWEETISSRTAQIKRKEEAFMKEFEEDEVLLKKWSADNEAAIEAERQKQIDARNKVIELKKIQKQDGLRLKEERERQKQIEKEESRLKLSRNDDQKYIERCKDTIEQYAREGKPIYTLLKALEYSEPQLLAAKTTKIERENLK